MARKDDRKPYRLKPGKTHRVPNPNYVEGKDDAATESHLIASEGDIVYLNDEQFKSFRDKFAPISTDSTDVRDDDDATLEAAKVAAAKTRQNINPNKPLEYQVAATSKPSGATAATQTGGS